MLGTSPERVSMTASAMREARGYVATIIGKQPPGSPLKEHFPRVARLFGMTERRVRAFWNGEAAPNGKELDAMRLVVARNVGRQACAELISYAARLDAVGDIQEAVSSGKGDLADAIVRLYSRISKKRADDKKAAA